MKKNRITFCILTSIIAILSGCEDGIVKNTDHRPTKNFEALWSILDERYCYFDAKELDWNGVRNIYARQVHDSMGTLRFFDLMSQMLDTLQDGHVNLYSPFDISQCKGWYSSYPEDYYADIVMGNRYLNGNYRSAGGFQYGFLCGDAIGYVRYGSFSSYSPSTLRYIDAIMQKTRGIIIDIRNNGGGNLDYSEQFASCFFSEKRVTGYIRHKTDKCHNCFSDFEPITVNPQRGAVDWSKKNVILLTNRRVYSAANDFTVRMKSADNVTVVGGRTGGGGGMPLSQELPNGWMIRFSAVPMYDTEYHHTEFGVDPHIEVHIKDKETGRDEILDYAINMLK